MVNLTLPMHRGYTIKYSATFQIQKLLTLNIDSIWSRNHVFPIQVLWKWLFAVVTYLTLLRVIFVVLMFLSLPSCKVLSHSEDQCIIMNKLNFNTIPINWILPILFFCKWKVQNRAQNALQRKWGNFPFANWNVIFWVTACTID